MVLVRYSQVQIRKLEEHVVVNYYCFVNLTKRMTTEMILYSPFVEMMLIRRMILGLWSLL